ncbi:hypothetical protein Zmor_020228 [Zophobas morio]|uniref:Uncharacterized protein n=1 Tax=Zophobas morio TaxID=2755281 RepID=A0AA38I349_9CUCU|nr:hypothetical protein Zmor_020228 [Zophobas morio]
MFRPWENQETVNNELRVERMEVEENILEENTRHHHYLSPDAKEIIRNVYHSLLEKECSAPIKVCSELVKKPYSTVRDIINSNNVEKKVRTHQKFPRIPDELGTEIKEVIYKMYKDNQLPTTRSLKLKLQELGFEIMYSDETFRQYLRSVGFHYNTLNQRLGIMETPRLKKMRWEYITKIRQFREEGRYIVCVDETDLVKKGLTDGTENCYLEGPPSRDKRIIILHAGGTDGWVPNGLFFQPNKLRIVQLTIIVIWMRRCTNLGLDNN